LQTIWFLTNNKTAHMGGFIVDYYKNIWYPVTIGLGWLMGLYIWRWMANKVLKI